MDKQTNKKDIHVENKGLTALGVYIACAVILFAFSWLVAPERRTKWS